jgi:hypothetical protein
MIPDLVQTRRAPAFIREYVSRHWQDLFLVDYERFWAQPFAQVAKDLTRRSAGVHTFWKAAHLRGGELLWAQPWTANALVDTGEADILDVYFINVSAPTGHFFLLLGNAPATGSLADTDTIASVTEVTGTGYARQQVDRGGGTPGFTRSGTAPTTVTSSTETFTATGTWTTANWLGLCDVASGTAGVLVAHTGLSTARNLVNGDSLQTSMAISLD